MSITERHNRPEKDLECSEQLRAEIAELREELAAEAHTRQLVIAELREALATEVRTRRLVVVDDAGNEVISTQVNTSFVEFGVGWVSGDGVEHRASLFAGDEMGGEASVCVSVGGNTVAMLMGFTESAPANVVADSYLLLDRAKEPGAGEQRLSERTMMIRARDGVTIESGALKVAAVMQVQP